MAGMARVSDQPDFDRFHHGDPGSGDAPALTPWDIGGPQPVVKRLVACGVLRGAVLDPGTGPGHHAIHYASRGYSATGIDISPTAIERAQRNAEHAGVAVNFAAADATTLDAFENRWDTVVDSAFYQITPSPPRRIAAGEPPSVVGKRSGLSNRVSGPALAPPASGDGPLARQATLRPVSRLLLKSLSSNRIGPFLDQLIIGKAVGDRLRGVRFITRAGETRAHTPGAFLLSRPRDHCAVE